MLDVASAVVRAGPGRSDVHRARGAGPLRLLCPRAAGDAGWIVTSSLGGGLVDGDDVALEVTVDPGAVAVVTTQASTKVYKGRSRQRTEVRVAGDGTALVVPDPVVPYRGASFAQVTRVELARDATLVLADVITAGRLAYGERWSAAQLDMTLSIAIEGQRVLHDRVVLAGDAAAHLGRFAALATCVLLGPRVSDLAGAQLEALGPIASRAPVVLAGSVLGDGAIVRIAGEDIAAVVATARELLEGACSRVGETPWKRKW